MFLTEEQLFELTHMKRPSAQAKWLRDRGWRFDWRADGTLIVHEEEARVQLCSGFDRRRDRADEPDFEALNEIQ